ncbi:polyprenyl synthetase family protein [Alicyclobacillus curvatus]|nr:polyprenyl synthetase family protein [Alicyclobacillus curvatus]
MDFRQVYDEYRTDLQEIDRLLRRSMESDNDLLASSSLQLLEAGGKRIRPLFALLCSELGRRGDRARVHTLAASIELVHMASLVHDDVIDDASVRRGHPTVRAQYGNRPAMYTGDFLFARAISLLSSLADTDLHIEMSNAIVRMTEGEIDQIRDFFDLEQPLKNYLRRIERKTALLISVSCSLGAAVGGASPDVVARVRRFGYFTGMAFQVIDDVLDFSGTESVVGKPVGNDLWQGNITYPVLYTVQCTAQGPELRSLISPTMTREELVQAVALVRDSGGIHQAEQLAERYLAKALAVLSELEPSDTRMALQVVARFVNQRLF